MEEKLFKHVMIDTETLGLAAGSVIRSVAAVEFDPETGETGRQRVWKLNMQQAINNGFKVDAATIKWWMTRSEAARKDFVEGYETDMYSFLTQLDDFLSEKETDFTLWCLQLDFDVPMLKAYYDWAYQGLMAFGERANYPWNRRRVRDVRPYMDALESAGLLPPKAEDRHTPLSDCLSQINYVHLAVKNHLLIR